MSFRKLSYYGNPFIGIFGKTNNKVTIVPLSSAEKFYKISEYLKTRHVQISIGGTDLVGLYSIMNDKGLLLSPVVNDQEKAKIKKELNEEGLDVTVLETKHLAIGNNVIANNTKAIVNQRLPENEVKVIKDTLDVEVMRTKIAEHTTVGAVALLTNKGFVTHPDIGEKHFEEISEFLGLKGGIGTANKGVPYLSLCVIANDTGSIFGEKTTAFEIQRILNALDQE